MMKAMQLPSLNFGGRLSTAVLVASLVVTSAHGEPAPAPSMAAIKPVISYNVLMVKFVDQAADVIWTAAVKPPKNDAEWEQVEYHATQLATTGTILQVGGLGPRDMEWRNSPTWSVFADKMTAFALAAAQAARKKDVAGVKRAGDGLILNCEGCHRAFKPEIPTQGIATHLSHAVIPSASAKPNCKE
jgi:hypothetical protein